MMRGLLGKILYQKRWFVLGWTLGFAAMALFMVLFYPSFKDTNLDQLLSGLSPALQKVAGGSDSMASLDNYISGQVFALRMPMLSIIMSIILCAGLFVGDEKRGVLTTHLSLPLSRTRVLYVKLLAALIIIAGTAVGMLVGIALGGVMVGESFSMSLVLQHMAGTMLIGLDFAVLVVLFGAGLAWRGLSTGLAAMAAFTSYLISSMVAVVSALEPIEKLSLFHYYQNPSPISLEHALLLMGFAAVCVVLGWLGFRRRDIGS